ncbi:hypothetical protein V2J09_002969 [Rumex salicifolius]
MAKLRIAGAWVGVLEVELDQWTVHMLKDELAKRSNSGPDSIKLICAGRILKESDENPNLAEIGVKSNAKILVSRIKVDEGQALGEQLQAEEERSAKLARLKNAAAGLAERHSDGSIPLDDYNIELENQSGQKVNLGSETDQRAMMMGLMMHVKGKHLIREHLYKDALEVLAMGEEAFSLCDPKLIEHIDNVPILQIDMVWCYFMLRDIRWLSDAGARLAKARRGILRTHGKDASRVRLLQGGCSTELALHLRLELLEGVVAYHGGQIEKCRGLLTSAQEKFHKLQVSDEALSLLMSMGYKENEAKRALKMNNQNVESAISFILEEREKAAQKHAENIQRKNEIKELKRYGKTMLGKAVDLAKLNYISSIGFDRELAAEALRRNENDTHKSLDNLTNPELNSKIQLDIETRKRKRQDRAKEAIISELVSMGFERSRVISAFTACGTKEAALDQLLSSEPEPNNGESTSREESGLEVLSNSASNLADEERPDEGPSSPAGSEMRDAEIEKELATQLDMEDALTDYDIDVTKEAEAINEYLALLNSSSSSSRKCIAVDYVPNWPLFLEHPEKARHSNI